MPVDDRLPDELLLQRRMSLGALLEVEVLPLVAGSDLHLELRVLVEVDDLDLRLRLDDVALTALERLELRSACDVAEDDPVELGRGTGLEGAFFTIVSCVPFCQLSNLKGPLEMSIESDQNLLKSWPATLSQASARCRAARPTPHRPAWA